MIRRWDAVSASRSKRCRWCARRSAGGLCRRPRRASVPRCIACHTLSADEGNKAGPTLSEIFGRRIATLPGYNFPGTEKTRHHMEPGDGEQIVRVGPMTYRPAQCRADHRSEDDRKRWWNFSKATKKYSVLPFCSRSRNSRRGAHRGRGVVAKGSKLSATSRYAAVGAHFDDIESLSWNP